MAMQLPVITNCSVGECSYNHNGCAAVAMTMGTAGCSTFVSLPEKGGDEGTTGKVGACQKADCSFNDRLECSAESVKIGGNSGECLTYHKVA